MNTEPGLLVPRLLVVDDEEVVCKSCSRIFEGQGIQVDAAHDARTGLSMAAKGRYAAILLDIKMPVMDGLAFLEEFRKTDVKTPVIMITGYSSVPSAATAMRLGAVDYIPKPFTPDEITAAVRRVLGEAVTTTTATKKPAGAVQATISAPVEGAFKPISDDRHFLDEGWAQVGEDGTVRAGAFLSLDEGGEAREVVLPRVGDTVHQGLPLIGFRKPGGVLQLVPSAVSGEVVEINPSLASSPRLAWEDPCREGWAVRIRPSRLADDLKSAAQRTVILMTTDRAASQARIASLGYHGCRVLTVKDEGELAGELRAAGEALIMVDGKSFGERGPELVGRVNSLAPAARVVVLADPKANPEAAYRSQRLFYYALEPVADRELIDLLASAFRPGTRSAAKKPVAAGLPSFVRRIRITNRHGETVSLLTSGGVLQESDGLGRELVERLLQGAYPVRVTLGRDGLTPMEIRSEANDADRILVIEVSDRGRLPGCLGRAADSELVQASGEAAKKTTALVIQPAPGAQGPLKLDGRSAQALAEALLQEMVA
jgi:CheY-like chemotaxis protein/glycine cleavage system H lipoate-binding protein